MRRGIMYLTIALAVAAFATAAQAQEPNYPSRAVHVLAAAAPGGNPDVLARLLSPALVGTSRPAFRR